MGKTNTIKKSYLKFIPYSGLDKWYVSYYLNPYLIKSQYPLFGLKEIIEPLQKKIKKDDYDGELPIVSKISFKDGKIHLRDENKTGMDLYEMPVNQLLVSKINFHQGAVSINERTKLVCSTHYQPYRIDNKKINSQYLVTVLRSKGFLNFLQYLRADGIKNEATYEFISQLKIPLPPLEEQNHIVEAYNKRIQLSEQQEQQANQIEQDIEKYLFGVLGLEKHEDKDSKKGLQFIAFKDIERWGVEFILDDYSPFVLLKTEKFKRKKLNNLCFINPQTDIDNASEISFIPMKYVSDNYGIIIKKGEINIQDIKGYTKFQENDLIWARITPCMQNGKSAIATNLLNGFACGSTEYHVIRKRTNNIELKFIHSVLRMKIVLHSAMKHFTGSAGQQRVPKIFLENLLIPLPPLKIQNEIANTIEKMKAKMKTLRQQADENREMAIEEFEKEIFQ